MKVTFLKKHTGKKPGFIAEVKDSLGKYLIKMGVAETGGEVTGEAILGTGAPELIKRPSAKKPTTKKATPKKSATKKAK